MNGNDTNQWEVVMAVINIAAVISSPVLAVRIGQYLQKRHN